MPYFTYTDDPAQHEPYMRCAKCNADLCTVEEGDSLAVIIAVADDHERDCPGYLLPEEPDVLEDDEAAEASR